MNRSTTTTSDAAMRRPAAQPYRETMGLRRQAAICFVAPPRRTRCSLYAFVVAPRICQPGGPDRSRSGHFLAASGSVARNAGHAGFRGGFYTP